MEKEASIVCHEQFQNALDTAVEEVRADAMRVSRKGNGGLDTCTRLGAELGETRQRLDQLALRPDNLAAGVEAGQGARQQGPAGLHPISTQPPPDEIKPVEK